jgi:hypothetical protein
MYYQLRALGVDVPEQEPDHFNFRVSLKGGDGEWKLSVSYPLDMMTEDKVETALFHNSCIFYSDAVGYQDVCRLDNDPKAVVEEIRRLEKALAEGRLVPDPEKRVASDSEEDSE